MRDLEIAHRVLISMSDNFAIFALLSGGLEVANDSFLSKTFIKKNLMGVKLMQLGRCYMEVMRWRGEESERRGFSRIKILPVVGHVHGLRETLRVRSATANVALTLMKYTHAYII